MTESVLPIPPEIIGSILVALATVSGTVLSTRITPFRNVYVMKNFWRFLATRKNIRNILGLDEIADREFRYRRISIIGTTIPALVIVLLFQLMNKSPEIWFYLFLANLVSLFITAGFYAALPFRLTDKTMGIYKIFRIFAYVIIFSGVSISYISFSSTGLNLIYYLLLTTIWFLAPIPLDYLNWSFTKELYNKLISKKIKENSERLPTFHFSFKNRETTISGKFRGMNKDYLVISDGEKDIMVMWKDFEICSIDNHME